MQKVCILARYASVYAWLMQLYCIITELLGKANPVKGLTRDFGAAGAVRL